MIHFDKCTEEKYVLLIRDALGTQIKKLLTLWAEHIYF